MDPEKKSLNFIFPTKYVIPKSLKFGHWLSEENTFRHGAWRICDLFGGQIGIFSSHLLRGHLFTKNKSRRHMMRYKLHRQSTYHCRMQATSLQEAHMSHTRIDETWVGRISAQHWSGQISIIPKPECFGDFGEVLLLNHHLGWPTGGKRRYNLPSMRLERDIQTAPKHS